MVRIMKSIEGVLYRGKTSKDVVIFLGKDSNGQCIIVSSSYNYEALEHIDKLESISGKDFEEKYEPIPDDQDDLDYYYTLIK